MTISACGQTDRGLLRPHNEDALLISLDHGVFAVADGMGGHAAGEVASGIAIEAVREVLDRPRAADDDMPGLIRRAIDEANRRIADRIQLKPEYRGMGTTLVLAVVEGDRYWIAHVGDSRAYRIRGSEIRQLTSDHSFVNELVRLGMLSREQAARDPRRNVVTRALGSGPSVVADVVEEVAQPGDLLLLCSDGLNSMLDDETILATAMAARQDLDDGCRRLVAAANAAGGEDNITVILVQPVGSPVDSVTPTQPVAAPPSDSGEQQD
ncbi:MAG: Stp1/IreP family PP2C-type Ser/Thr phosphatase [Acidobacteriota bacterium]|nr:Stp1/IreP family PP2C-type Ser/Thr phosphatase [Acidobacteriota bacterium]MDQ7088030.1 Stp1/IreP family PP2C-type Ser/Thr phosphatase [Acidobacteriota bacterium]